MPAAPRLVPPTPYPAPVPVERPLNAVLSAPLSVIDVVALDALSCSVTTLLAAAAVVSGRAADATTAAAEPAAAANKARLERTALGSVAMERPPSIAPGPPVVDRAIPTV